MQVGLPLMMSLSPFSKAVALLVPADMSVVNFTMNLFALSYYFVACFII